ncbi:histone-lysine N-methyltransferase eggless-like [Bradysia coprophila]|uniref:histone-lysine N-methyltransferase eggless-like n=1 Tax=Bradysia coprophila TaxID=38358 RepID=UPI00187DAAF5|nr:histone-lysine N-methyltransferase eggless-like [Bradysia coprophila]
MEHCEQTSEIMDIEKNAKLSKIIEDNSASNHSNRSDGWSDAITGGHHDVVSLLSDNEGEVMNSNGSADDNAESMGYGLNNEATWTLVEPTIVQRDSNDSDSGIVMPDNSVVNFREQSAERTQNSQKQEAFNINCTDLQPNCESVTSNILNSLASNEFQHDAGSADDKTTRKKCINSECSSDKKKTTFYDTPIWSLNYFNVPRNYSRRQSVCQRCFDVSINDYERLGAALVNQQPLMLERLPIRPEVVEIIDSEEEDKGGVGDTEALPSNTLTLLEENVDVVLQETVNRFGIEQQMRWANQILEHRVDVNSAISDRIDEEIRSMDQLRDSMYKNLYSRSRYAIEELPPFDLNTNKRLHMFGPNYPPCGKVVYPPVDKNSFYYAVRTKLLSTWMPCKVTEYGDGPVDGKPMMFTVQFLRRNDDKTVPGNHLAYGTAPVVRLNVGTRVIALTMEKSVNVKCLNFHPGIVGETLQEYNRWRYMIFFDDGCVRYVTPDNVRLICSPSPNVWEDVSHDAVAAAFIKSYLEQYKTERPMVQVKPGQKMLTQWRSEWKSARVANVDASLVHMHFEDVKRWEWIYRGSTRLGPLFKDNHQRQRRFAIAAKGNESFVELVSSDDDDESKNCRETTSPTVKSEDSSVPNTFTIPSQVDPERKQENRAIAKKGTGTMPSHPTVQHMNKATIYIDEDSPAKGKVVHYTVKQRILPRKFVSHICGTACLYPVKYNLSSYSPLVKPLLSGWDRKSVMNTRTSRRIVYQTPCGRIMRNMQELHRYLRDTKCTSLDVDNFDFGGMTSCLAEYLVDNSFIQTKDLSNGCEAMTVSSVNFYDNTTPPPCEYSAQRIPTDGVPLNLDPDFLCGCDCDDDCWDKTKCQCWKLTLEGAKLISPYIPIDRMGYKYKRLLDPIPTGVYECNAQCKCSKMCLNRVAQHPLQLKLQVFKTKSRGWGLRCLNDVPEGSFVCVYAGDLLTDKSANIAGGEYGDEYFAELDFIEVIESLKEGYEPEAMDVDSGRNSVHVSSETSIDVSKSLKVEPVFNTDDDEIQVLNEPSLDENASSVCLLRSNSTLRFYDKNEMVFTMDAKKHGNIGRYINHSCDPNLFVQNVFVDTHDLRFPWVAFFAKRYIAAGTELTWDYNYVVGSVPGKRLFCECGAQNCRRRIL